MSKKLIDEKLSTLQILKKELYEYFITEMIKDPTIVEDGSIRYGNFRFSHEITLKDNVIVGKVFIREGNYMNVFELNIKPHRFGLFGEKRTLDNYLENELFKLYIKRNEALKKKAEMIRCRNLINNLPPERKKQFMREQKLERIVGEDE